MTSSFSIDQFHFFADQEIASRQTIVKNENLALTACLFNAGFSGNLIIVSRIKVFKILTGKQLRTPALNKHAAR
jgi:hypothetical protein